MHIQEVIAELLLRNNCVIVPNFGGFVARVQSARIDYDNGVMYPPQKSLLFNRQLINNDGLLVNELSKRFQVSFDEALQELRLMVQRWNQELKAGHRVSIDRVGYLFIDDEQNLCFEQDRFFNLLLASYGMGKVHFVSEVEVKQTKIRVLEQPTKVVEQATMVKPVVRSKQTEVEPEPVKVIAIDKPEVRKSKTWRYIAAACLLPFGFYTFWIPLKTDVLQSGVLSFHDFNPFYKNQPALYTSKKMALDIPKSESIKTLEEQVAEIDSRVEVYQYNFSDDFFIPVKIEQSSAREPIADAVSEIPEQVEQITAAKTDAVVGKQMDYIVGCFQSESNANSLVATLKTQGLDARVVDVKNGLYRVSAGGATTAMEFQQIQQAAKSKGFDGWVLKK